MKKTLLALLLGCATLVGYASTIENDDTLRELLSRPSLPVWAATSSFDVVLREVDAADRKADDALLACSTPRQLQKYCTELRKRMFSGLGDLPEVKCPLNAKVVDTVIRDGYRVEKIIFESWPGIHVTANLFLPDNACFKPPYPVVLQPCGHTTESKGSVNYQRLCVIAVNNGLAVLVYDTINTGERKQGLEDVAHSWEGHNRIGALADPLGQSFGGFRVWDAIRALDYLDTRNDIRHDGYGCFGNSGGGNITSFLTALDNRVVASAPNGYITTFRDAARDANIGPGDAEQNIFGQLTSGVNHLAFCLMRAPVPIMIGSTSGDHVFPFCGTAETYENLKNIYAKMNWDGRTAHVWGEGLHGYRESTRTAAVAWMCKWLLHDPSAWSDDISVYQAIDKEFDISAPGVDQGLVNGLNYVAPEGDVRNLPGNRTYYDLLREELNNILTKRGSAKVDPEVVRKVAHIRQGKETGFIIYDTFQTISNTEYKIERGTFKFTNGLVLPSLLITGKDTAGTPLIIVANDSMSMHSDEVRKAVANGRPVLMLDLIGCGEIAKQRRNYYGVPYPEEEMSVLLRSIGRTCVGEQAEELIIAADFLKKRFGTSVEICAHQRTCVAAAHAHASEPELISSVTKIDPPSSWKVSIEQSLRIPFSITVPGALKFYDWTDL